ncbi:MAG: DUF2784 domain-containing protein [Ideonella sp. WA131b]|jgi:hypothetical protein|nr:DUF2784 domain-containing protein [Ideonella sp. WA131b]
MWRAAADAVLVLHAAVVLFVVGGLVLVVAGNLLRHAAGGPRWPWVNRPWFRLLHGTAIATVVAQAWLGITCPLTTLEWWLRAQAGEVLPEQGFIELWLHRLLFYTAPRWVFATAYTAFGLAVAAAWWRWPPRRG